MWPSMDFSADPNVVPELAVASVISTATGTVRRVFAVVCIAALSWLVVSPVQARITPLSPRVQLNVDAAQGQPAIVALPGGRSVVVWQGPNGLVGRVFDGKAAPDQAEFQVVGDLDTLQPIAAAGGGFVVAAGASYSPQVVLNAFAADGSPLTAEPIHAEVNTYKGWALVSGATRSPLFLWTPGHEILGQWFDGGVQPLGPVFSLGIFGDHNQISAAITADDGFAVAWWDEGFGSIWARRANAHGEANGEPFRVASAGQPGHPSVCADEGGGFVVAWTGDYRGGGFRRYAPEGTATTPPLDIGTRDGTRVLCIAEGSVLLAGMGDVAGVGQSVLGRLLDAADRPSGQFVIPTTFVSPGPSVTKIANDEFDLTWARCRGPRFDQDCDVFAQRFSAVPGSDCTGDCNGDEVVTIDELIEGVRLALYVTLDSESVCYPGQSCPALDFNLDCDITVDEVLIAINRGLEGCE